MSGNTAAQASTSTSSSRPGNYKCYYFNDIYMRAKDCKEWVVHQDAACVCCRAINKTAMDTAHPGRGTVIGDHWFPVFPKVILSEPEEVTPAWKKPIDHLPPCSDKLCPTHNWEAWSKSQENPREWNLKRG